MCSQSTPVTESDVKKALSRIVDPDRGGDLISLGMVMDIAIRHGNVAFAIQVDRERAPRMEAIRRSAEQAVLSLPGVVSTSAVLTAQRLGAAQPAGGMERKRARPPHEPVPIPGVRAIVAVASGKGGVGKSTVAVNLAVAAAAAGVRTALLDADIYGPSAPRMMGLSGRPELSEKEKIVPLRRYGVSCMSMGFLVDEETPLIWRGPMVMSALTQLLREVVWGELDVMFVDMPPGTGDAQLTLTQSVPLAGAVIISTPQDVALTDARKGLQMFRKVSVPILGLIENMSYFHCPHCHERSEIFDHGGTRREAERLNAPFLGEIPLALEIRKASDQGIPIVEQDPGGAHAQAYRDITARLLAALDIRS